MPKKMSLDNRFWEKVDKGSNNECWNWLASQNGHGYGQICDGFCGIVSAHRISWEIHFGPIPEGKLVLHKCDNKRCVNPNHLYLGTQSDNRRDAVLRNSKCSGKNIKTSNFYEGEAWLMKRLYRSKKFTQKQISKMFRCNQATISHIVNGKTTNFMEVI